MKRFLLYIVVVLSTVGVYAQNEAPTLKETNAVGVETTSPYATLDVNGDARLRKVELMTTSTPTEEVFSDCPCVLTIDEYGVVHRIPKEKYGSTDSGTPPASTTYTSTKSYTATGVYRNRYCGSGKIARDYTVSHTETVTLTSKESQEDADKKALDEATRLAKQWVKEHGQSEANTYGGCRQKPKTYSRTKVCDEKGQFVFNIPDDSLYYIKPGDSRKVKKYGSGEEIECGPNSPRYVRDGNRTDKGGVLICVNSCILCVAGTDCNCSGWGWGPVEIYQMCEE